MPASSIDASLTASGAGHFPYNGGMSARRTEERPQIGWREWIALPDLGIDRVKAKIDTGARSSALHAWDVQVYRKGGQAHVRFVVHPIQRDNQTSITTEAPLLDHRWVKSSLGNETLRAVIETNIALGQNTWPIELSLVNRDAMGFRLLIGRQALRAGKLLVNPSRSFLLSKRDLEKRQPKRKR
jgi:hypothetical protein